MLAWERLSHGSTQLIGVTGINFPLSRSVFLFWILSDIRRMERWIASVVAFARAMGGGCGW